MHRHIPTTTAAIRADETPELHARVWWTCFALERLFELETTRPTSIPHGEHDPFLPAQCFSLGSQASLRYFISWVSLTIIFERISSLLYRRTRGPESTLHLLHHISALDHALRAWKNSLPEDIRPDSALCCSDADRPFATFLALHYHAALITLHRASLVLPPNQFLEEIEAHAPDLPFHQRLRNGASLCAASARASIRLAASTGGQHPRLQSPLHTLTQILHGCVVLALSILRHPHAHTVRADLELLVTGTGLAENEYSRLGQHPRFIEACGILRREMDAYVLRYGAGQAPTVAQRPPRQGSLVTGAESGALDLDMDFATPASQDAGLPTPFGSAGPADLDGARLFEGVAIEDLWMGGAETVRGGGEETPGSQLGFL